MSTHNNESRFVTFGNYKPQTAGMEIINDENV